MTGVWVLAGVLVAATAAGLVWRSRAGAMRASARPDVPSVWEALGVPLGERATLVQFSSAFCQPCRATRAILTQVAGTLPGVAYVEVDAEQHLELVRALGVLKTPTTFVLDAGGAVVRRAAGQPRKADVVAALGLAIP